MNTATKSRLDLVRSGRTGRIGLNRGRMVVSLDKLVEDPNNERKTFRNMDGLIQSMRAVGQVEALVVTPEEGGLFKIHTGARRYRAMKAAGVAQAEVIVRDPEDERNRRLKSIVSNVQREDVGPVEMAECLQSLLDDGDLTQQQLADTIGKDKTWVSRMLRILDLPVELQSKLATSQRSIPYDSAAEIARVKDKEDQERLVGSLMRGATTRQIREEIKQLKGESEPKPKRVFHTTHRAVVIVQAQGRTLSKPHIEGALREALEQAAGG